MRISTKEEEFLKRSLMKMKQTTKFKSQKLVLKSLKRSLLSFLNGTWNERKD